MVQLEKLRSNFLLHHLFHQECFFLVQSYSYLNTKNKVEKDNTKESKVDDKIVPSSTDKNIKNLSSNFEGTSGKESGTGLGGGVNPKIAAAGGGLLAGRWWWTPCSTRPRRP